MARKVVMQSIKPFPKGKSILYGMVFRFIAAYHFRTFNRSNMSIFQTYLAQQEELKELQKQAVQVTKTYNNELKLFQKENIINAEYAERLKEKYDDLQQTNARIQDKEEDIRKTSLEIEQYLAATNGMAIRYTYEEQGLQQALIFEMGVNSLGEPILIAVKEI